MSKTVRKPDSEPARVPRSRADKQKVKPARNDQAAQEPDEEHDSEEEQIKKQVLVLIPSWLVSLVVHSVLLLVLMAFTLPPPQSEFVEVLSYAEEEQEIEDITVVQLEEIDEIEFEEPIAMAQAVELVSDVISYEPVVPDSPPEAASMSSQFEDFDSMFADGELIDIGNLAGEGEAIFFGTKAVARRIIFIVDNSNSMNGGRLETALVALQESVDYDIKFVGGIKTAFFGGEGLFFAHLKGPGKVYLQTLPFSRLADRVISSSARNVGEVKRGGSVLGTLGDIIGGDR